MGHVVVGDKNGHAKKKGLNREVVERVEVWKQLCLLYPYGTNEASTNSTPCTCILGTFQVFPESMKRYIISNQIYPLLVLHF